MKIALINHNYGDDGRRVYIPLGLAYIAAVLKESKRHEVMVIDASAFGLSHSELESRINDFGADLVAVGAATEVLKSAIDVCGIAKKNGMISVIGGPHATIASKETLEFKEVDFVIIGEGEYTLLDLADSIENKKDLGKVKGIMFKKNDTKMIKTPPRMPIENLDELPFPAREMFPWQLYSSYTTIVRKTPCMHMMTSRGCPFKCTFCGSQSLWKGCRSRSPKSIVDEIEHLIKKFGVKEIYIMDDTFNLDIKRSEAICDEIIKRNVKIFLRVQARVFPMTEELLKKMKKAGVWCIYYGVESGNQKVLNSMKKGTTLKQIRDAFKMTKKIGIKTFGFFMIGLPEDTRSTIKDTMDFALELNPDIANFTVVAPYPGTEIYENTVREGKIEKIKPGEIYTVKRYPHRSVSDKELQDTLSKIFKKFYLRPEYILKRFLNIRTWDEFKANFLSALPLLQGNKSFIVNKKWIAPAPPKN